MIQHVDREVDNPDLAAAARLASNGVTEPTFTIKHAGVKTAFVEQGIADWLRLGGIAGPGAPQPFQQIGGPLTGAALKALLLGGLGYTAGRYLTPLFSKRLDPRKVGALAGGLGALAGSAIHIPGLIYNFKERGLPGINFHPSQMLGRGKAGAGIQPGQLFDQVKHWLRQRVETARPYVKREVETARSYVERGIDNVRPYVEREVETARPYVERGIRTIRSYLNRLMGKSSSYAGQYPVRGRGVDHNLDQRDRPESDSGSSQVLVKLALTPELYQQDIDTFISSKRYLGAGATATLSREFLPGGQPYGAPTPPGTRANIAVSDWIYRINQDPYMSPLDKAKAKLSIEEANYGRGTGLTSGYDVAKAMVGHGLAGLGAAAAIGQLMSRTSDLPVSKRNKLWGIGLIGGALHGYLKSRR